MLEPHYLIGREAVRLLRGRVLRPTREVASQALDFTWLDLETCVPPPASSSASSSSGAAGLAN
jgi:hypothetical protein